MNAVFLNRKQTDCHNYDVIKESHKRFRDQSILFFKEKAVGQNLKDFEVKILDEIQKKYLLVK